MGYQILYAQPKRPNVVVLVRNMVAQYAALASALGPMGLAVKVEPDKWIASKQHRQAIMGDFNDNL